LLFFGFDAILRVHDNKGFLAALQSGLQVLPIFIFDKNILAELPKYDRRVDLILQALTHMQKQFNPYGASLLCIHDTPLQAFQTLIGPILLFKRYSPTTTMNPMQERGIQKLKIFLEANKSNFSLLKIR
jgi:deoxyribodipyrimidine photolyase